MTHSGTPWHEDTPVVPVKLMSEDTGIEIDVAAHCVLIARLIASVNPVHLSISDMLSEDLF